MASCWLRSGDFIVVAAATYTENLTISFSLNGSQRMAPEAWQYGARKHEY
jgi:hypothetical protein